MANLSNYKHKFTFYQYDPKIDDYSIINNPRFWKFTNDGKRIPYTDDDISNPLIQPYNKEGTELIIREIASRPGEFIVKTSIRNNSNDNSNMNAVSINDIIGEVSGKEMEELSRLRKKYKIVESGTSHIGNKDLVTRDLLFLYNYYQYILQFYRNQITKRKSETAFKNAMKQELSYINVFKNDNGALQDFLNFFKEDLKTYSDIADRYPVLDLQNQNVFTNPMNLYNKILELQHDLDRFHSIAGEQITQSKQFMNIINERLKSKKRKRNHNNNNNNNSNEVYPSKKRLTFTLPKFAQGGKKAERKSRKTRKNIRG
jgi:hypothetical protein